MREAATAMSSHATRRHSVRRVVHTRSLAITALALASSIGIAACSKSSNSSATTTSTTAAVSSSTSGAPSTTSGSSSSSGDTALAKSALLTQADFPSGWTSTGSVTTGGSSKTSRDPAQTNQFAQCIGVPASQIDDSGFPTADSPTFQDAQGNAQVDDEVKIWPSASAASSSEAAFNNPKTPSCFLQVMGTVLQQQIQKNLPSGSSVGQVTASSGTFPQIGEASGEIELQVPLTVQGQTITAYFDIVTVQKGRSITTLTLTNPTAAFDPNLAQQLATKAASLMTA